MADEKTIETPTGKRISLIEDRLDAERMAQVMLGSEPGDMVGVKFRSMMEIMEFAKLMAVSGVSVPPYLRGNPGACLAIVVRAHEIGMSPFFVANVSYEVENKGVKRIAYESAFYHAIIEARAPIKGGLRHEIIGEGDDRYCRVWAVRRDTGETIEFKGDTLGKLRPPKNDNGVVKGSPLWVRKPNVQLFYDASRDFARIHFPHILAGLPTIDEVMDEEARHVGVEAAKDVTLGDRLRLRNAAPAAAIAAPREGFSDRSIHDHINAAVAAATPKEPPPPDGDSEGGKRKRRSTTIDGTATEVAEAAPAGERASATAAAGTGEGMSGPAADLGDPPEPDPAARPESYRGTASAEPLESQLPIEDAPTTVARKRGIADRKAGKKRREVPEEYRASNRAPEALAWVEGFESKGDE